jgi:hypothetical protein
MKTQKQNAVYKLVKDLYTSSEREMGQWMWKNHVQWVASKASELAEKYDGNQEKVYAGALLHDLGDVWFERDDELFDTKGNKEGEKILLESGFTKEEAQEILQEIVEPHSCYPGNLPKTIEGKCLASADAMFHLVTDFFPQFCWKHIPESLDYSQWIDWVTEKLERDFNNKIFFEDEKSEVEPYYESLKRVYVDTRNK